LALSVILPTATHGLIRLRCVTPPDAAQATLLAHLGIVLRKRMRLSEHQLTASASPADITLTKNAVPAFWLTH
jgi:hypothetical protein